MTTDNHTAISLSLPPEMVAALDEERGDVPRTTFIMAGLRNRLRRGRHLPQLRGRGQPKKEVPPESKSTGRKVSDMQPTKSTRSKRTKGTK